MCGYGALVDVNWMMSNLGGEMFEINGNWVIWNHSIQNQR